MVIVKALVWTTPICVGSLVLGAIAAEPLPALMDSLSSLGVLFVGAIGMLALHILCTYASREWGGSGGGGLMSAGGVGRQCRRRPDKRWPSVVSAVDIPPECTPPCLVRYPLLFYSFTRKNPYAHLAGMTHATTIALGTASSAVTLPTTIECCEKLGYSPSLSRFVLSLGATISMDGTAMYNPAVIIWLAAQVGIEMDGPQLIILVIIATLTSMGASPTPGSGAALLVVTWASVFPDEPLPQEIVTRPWSSPAIEAPVALLAASLQLPRLAAACPAAPRRAAYLD